MHISWLVKYTKVQFSKTFCSVSLFLDMRWHKEWSMCYMQDKNILCDRLVVFCTDGAPSLADHKAGLCALLKKVPPSAVWTHCVIHREQPATRALSPELSAVLQQVSSTVNTSRISLPTQVCLPNGVKKWGLMRMCCYCTTLQFAGSREEKYWGDFLDWKLSCVPMQWTAKRVNSLVFYGTTGRWAFLPTSQTYLGNLGYVHTDGG